jgi:hypothetical protein
MTSLLHLLHNTGLKNMYPLVCRLFSIATTLPLSTAEDEFCSQVKLIKTSHKSSIKTKTLNHLLNIQLNCDKTIGTCPTTYSPGLTLEGNSGKEVALWLLTSLCTSAKREMEVAL